VRVLRSGRMALEGRLEDARAKEQATRAAADALRADLDASRAAAQRATALPVRRPGCVAGACLSARPRPGVSALPACLTTCSDQCIGGWLSGAAKACRHALACVASRPSSLAEKSMSEECSEGVMPTSAVVLL